MIDGKSYEEILAEWGFEIVASDGTSIVVKDWAIILNGYPEHYSYRVGTTKRPIIK